jgi:hypothetical protein
VALSLKVAVASFVTPNACEPFAFDKSSLAVAAGGKLRPGGRLLERRLMAAASAPSNTSPRTFSRLVGNFGAAAEG